MAGWFLNWLHPLPSFSGKPLEATGALMGLAGTSLALWGVYELHRAGTAVRPGNPVTALVTWGPYRYTRNPLYVAVTIIYLGIVSSSGLVWLLATLAPALAIVHWKIVLYEEQFLEGRFGDSYRAYKAQVRRWI